MPNRDAQAYSHTPLLRAEAALLKGQAEGAPNPSVRSPRGGVAISSSGACEGAGAAKQLAGRGPRLVGGGGDAAALYGPGNKYRLGVLEPQKMTADLRARERVQADKVSSENRQNIFTKRNWDIPWEIRHRIPYDKI